VLPATPPPDIDLERWAESLSVIERWAPRRLYLTHFGPVESPAAHLAMYRAAMARSAERVRASLAEDGDDEARIGAWEAWLRADVRTRMPEEAAVAAESAAPFRQLWLGLARYWRKRESAAPP
jgi:hypothetical protein